MADYCDHASRYTETLTELVYLRYRKRTGPKATGKCLCCDHPLPAGRRWCDAWCRDEYLKEWRLLLPKDVPPAEHEELVVFGTATNTVDDTTL